jgi:hypothetical protein
VSEKHQETPKWQLPGQNRHRLPLRGLHLGSGSAMNLCSTRLRYLVEAAGSSPQQAEGEPPVKERVNSACHDRFPKLKSVPRVADVGVGFLFPALRCLRRVWRSFGPQSRRLPLPTSREGLMGEEMELAMPSAGEIKGIMEQLKVLQTLDERSMTLSVSINFAYWRLGVAYQAFTDVSLYTRHFPD